MNTQFCKTVEFSREEPSRHTMISLEIKDLADDLVMIWIIHHRTFISISAGIAVTAGLLSFGLFCGQYLSALFFLVAILFLVTAPSLCSVALLRLCAGDMF